MFGPVLYRSQCRRDGELSAGRKTEGFTVRFPHPAAAYELFFSSYVARAIL